MALTDNLLSYYKLDEASGNATDSVGSNTLTDVLSVGSGAGKINTARHFVAASTQYLFHATNADFQTGDVDFTFACWINGDTVTGFPVIAGKWTSGADREWVLDLESSKVTFFVQELGGLHQVTANTFGVLTAGTWYYVMGRHDATNNLLAVSVNGVKDETSYSLGVQSGVADFTVGKGIAGGGYFDGLIDEAGWWKRALTDAEVTQLYNGGAGLAYPFVGGTQNICHLATAKGWVF